MDEIMRRDNLATMCSTTALLAVVAMLMGAAQGADWERHAAAGWQPRDSQVEFVLHERMWIGGGWFQSHEAPPRDVWSSADGTAWQRDVAQAPWRHSDLAMSVVFDGRAWVMGGWFNGRLPGHSASNEVWSSPDGIAWTQVTAGAGWSPRLAAGLVEHRGRLWMLGGSENYYFGDAKSLKNDVWSSADGRTWREEIAHAPWKPRAYHQAVAFNDRIYVLGGGNYVPGYESFNDVWSSADGVNWTCETESAPWGPRLWFGSVVYRGRIWVLGGWSKEKDNFGDVWHSADGREWQRLETEHCWKSRHEHSTVVFKDKIWVLGGHARPLSNEVWSLHLPVDWKPAGGISPTAALGKNPTVACVMPWRVNTPLATVQKEIYRKQSRRDAAATGGRWYVGPKLEMCEVQGEEAADDVHSGRSIRFSNDNGRTWTPAEPLPDTALKLDGVTQYSEFEGGCLATLFDDKAGVLVDVWLRQIQLGNIWGGGTCNHFSYYRVSRDFGRTWSKPKQLRYEDGADFDPEKPTKAEFLLKNQAYFGNNIIRHSNGTLITAVAHANAADDPQNDTRTWKLGSLCFVGTWDTEKKDYSWKAGRRVSVPDTVSSRGLMEPSVAELKDGRVLVVWRGSDTKTTPGRKWFSLSSDGGLTLSPPAEWKYDDGTGFYSPSSIHQFIRHSVTGKLYWFGNITPVPPAGNLPRYPLVMAEVDETLAALEKDTVTLIDDRPDKTDTGYQLSNFSLYENRETHDFELFLTTYGQENGQKNWMNADQWRYRVTIGPEAISTGLAPGELCVATAQPLVVPGDVSGNIDRMVPLITEAARRGARLVVTSEAGICGYDLDGRGAAAAMPLDSPVLDRVAALARDHDIVTVAGLYERDGEAIHNSAVVFYPDGRRVVQRKRMLVGKEATFARPGDRRRVLFDVEGFRCGILICADTGIDGIYDDLARDGCDVALILTAGGGSESIALHQDAVETPEARATYAAEAAQCLSADTIRRAMELDMAMVFCNQSGWVPAYAYYHGGGSAIIDRTGRVAAVIPYRKILEHVRPDLAVGTVSR